MRSDPELLAEIDHKVRVAAKLVPEDEGANSATDKADVEADTNTDK